MKKKTILIQIMIFISIIIFIILFMPRGIIDHVDPERKKLDSLKQDSIAKVEKAKADSITKSEKDKSDSMKLK